MTSTYAEMLELLGVAPETQPSTISSQLSATSEGPVTEAAFAVSYNGTLAANCASEKPASVADPEPAALSPAALSDDQPQPRLLEFTAGAGSAPIAGADDDREDPTRDANTGREYDLRSIEFEREHPWLWGDEDQEEGGAKCGPTVEEMKLVWHAEHTKVLYPELHAAALDPRKYKEYMEKNDLEMPVPPPKESESEEEGDPVCADSPRCQFIKSDGEPCGCPALKRRRLCHFHSKTTDSRKRKNGKSAGKSFEDKGPENRNDKTTVGPDFPALELPVLEDDRAIQMAVTNVCRRLADATLEPKRAATLLYGLQVASVAVRRRAQNR